MRKPYVRKLGNRWWIEEIGPGAEFSGPWDTEEEANAAKEKFFNTAEREKPSGPGDPV